MMCTANIQHSNIVIKQTAINKLPKFRPGQPTSQFKNDGKVRKSQDRFTAKYVKRAKSLEMMEKWTKQH